MQLIRYYAVLLGPYRDHFKLTTSGLNCNDVTEIIVTSKEY